MDIEKLIEGLKGRLETGTPKGWSASSITIGRAKIKDVQVHDRGGCLDLIDTLTELLEKTRRSRPTAASQDTTLRVETTGPTKLLSAAIGVYLQDCKRRALSPKTIESYEATLGLLLAVVGDVPISRVSHDHIRELWDLVRWMPRNPKQQLKYRGKTVFELAEIGRENNVPGPSAHVFNGHWRSLRAFFTKLVSTKDLAASPLEGLDLVINEKCAPKIGRAFTQDELAKIFDPATFLPWALEAPHRMWVPQLALYTGARVSELAQLKVSDVGEVGGIPVLHFRRTFDEGTASEQRRTSSQRLKSKTSRRTVPIAKAVLDAGFLTYVKEIRATGHPRLFPHLGVPKKLNGGEATRGYGDQMASQFSRYAKSLGIESGVAIHAFRHYFITAIRSARVPDATASALTGHDAQVRYAGLANYQHHGAEVEVAEMAEALSKFAPKVPLLPYKAGMFRRQLENGWRFRA